MNEGVFTFVDHKIGNCIEGKWRFFFYLKCFKMTKIKLVDDRWVLGKTVYFSLEVFCTCKQLLDKDEKH